MTQVPRFYLTPNTFLCLHGDYCVFLDLRQDEYFCLPRMATSGFGDFVSGWPLLSGTGAKDQSAQDADIEARLQELEAAGLLTTCCNDGKEAAPVSVQRPERSLHDEQGDASGKKPLRPGDVAGFLTACGRAAFRLRWRSIEDIVRAVERRKMKHGEKGKKAGLPIVAEITSRFDRLRPWFPRKYLCLFDSLALIEFLARHNEFPTWVFGVQTEPFRAHCWVQQGEAVLNDRLDRVRSFTPIMAI